LSLNGQPFLEPKNLEEEGYQETYSFPVIPKTNTTEKIDGKEHPDPSIPVKTGSPVGSTLSNAELTKAK